MKKIILILSAALMLTGCNGLFKTEASAMAADSDSIVLNDDEFIEEVEGGEPVPWALSAYEKELMNIDDLPESAVLQERLGSLLLYVNAEAAPDEDNPEGTYSVWVASEERVIVAKVLTTNPTAAASWDKMTGKDASGVEVPTVNKAYSLDGKFIRQTSDPEPE